MDVTTHSSRQYDLYKNSTGLFHHRMIWGKQGGISVFSFAFKAPTLEPNTVIYKSHFELKKQDGKLNANLHSFLSSFVVAGFKTTRVSIFEVPMGAEIDFTKSNEEIDKSHFTFYMQRTPPNDRYKFYSSVKSVTPVSTLLAKDFTSALENALLHHDQTKNLSVWT